MSWHDEALSEASSQHAELFGSQAAYREPKNVKAKPIALNYVTAGAERKERRVEPTGVVVERVRMFTMINDPTAEFYCGQQDFREGGQIDYDGNTYFVESAEVSDNFGTVTIRTRFIAQGQRHTTDARRER